MKILQAHRCFYLKGGAEKVFFDADALLRAHCHDVAFFSMQHPDNLPSPYAKYFVSSIDYGHGGLLHGIKALGRLLYSREARQKIDRLIADFKPDVAHLHNIYHQISPSILHSLKKAGVPVVMTLHDFKAVCANYYMIDRGKMCQACQGGRYYKCAVRGCVKESRLKSLPNTLEMYVHHTLLHIYDLVDVFISPSQFLKDKITEMGFKGRIEVLPNFVDAADFTPSYGGQERSIVFVGRMSYEKGIKTLLNAVKGLDITLKMIGDGPLRAELEEKVKSEGISNVRFLGYLKGDVLKSEIQKSLFAVLPSECYENNPVSVMEAFALGKPVVGSRMGGIPELVKDGETGYTFTSFQAAELTDVIKRLANDPAGIERMGKAGRRLVEENYSADKHYNGLIGIYGQLGIGAK
ncbi:MAG: glycosyltransferase family 4 protein [Candidatus Omnitrophota bacterium]